MSQRDLEICAGWAATAGRFLWHEKTRTVVVADLHLGIEVAYVRQGIYLPETYWEPMRDAWEAMVEREPARVVIAGDLFDSPAPGARAVERAAELLRTLSQGCRVVITLGNHDPEREALLEMMKGMPLEVKAEMEVGGAMISHGHGVPDFSGSAATKRFWIVGHQHPAVTLATRVQAAKMAAYVRCKAKGCEAAEIVILPAFSRAPLGCNLLSERQWLLPVMRPANEEMRMFGLVESDRGNQVLDFGTLAMLEGSGS